MDPEVGVVTSIDSEILLLDEAIGSVDGEFLNKALVRLQDLVDRSGILVFAAHSNEFLARMCRTAIWIDHGPDQNDRRDRRSRPRL
jgi:ABC-2 type transport system ATP-binding protein